ncbi:hypothetical protein NM688_g1300 [Phlebia brevispora]|uniref:Uncharacterized protein n=1 Tax=Phlebia brevispora TaxID=194682 RepID=A0ACC1TC74_9APHY|nr:hypothetical protein NM688_g1300 [Phlebia brevispora]
MNLFTPCSTFCGFSSQNLNATMTSSLARICSLPTLLILHLRHFLDTQLSVSNTTFEDGTRMPPVIASPSRSASGGTDDVGEIRGSIDFEGSSFMEAVNNTLHHPPDIRECAAELVMPIRDITTPAPVGYTTHPSQPARAALSIGAADQELSSQRRNVIAVSPFTRMDMDPERWNAGISHSDEVAPIPAALSTSPSDVNSLFSVAPPTSASRSASATGSARRQATKRSLTDPSLPDTSKRMRIAALPGSQSIQRSDISVDRESVPVHLSRFESEHDGGVSSQPSMEAITQQNMLELQARSDREAGQEQVGFVRLNDPRETYVYGAGISEKQDSGQNGAKSLDGNIMPGTKPASSIGSIVVTPTITEDDIIVLAIRNTAPFFHSDPHYDQFKQLAQASREAESQIKYWAKCCKDDKNVMQFVDAILCTMQHMLDAEPSPDAFNKSNRQLLQRMMLKLSQTCEVIPASLFRQGAQLYQLEPVGGGGYSSVYRGELDKRVVAFKQLRINMKGMSHVKSLKYLSREALLWRQLRHRHVLPFLGLHGNPTTAREACYMLSPWMEKGNLSMYLQRTPKIAARQKYTWILEVAEGLLYLHDNSITHGDLRGANILLDATDCVYLADFGLATMSYGGLNTHGFSTWSPGATRWMSPNVVVGERCEKTGDVYSFACVCLEVVTQRIPFHEIEADMSVVFEMGGGRRLQWPTNEDKGYHAIGQSEDFEETGRIVAPAWDDDPNKRPKLQKLKDDLHRDFDRKYLDPLAN